MTASTKQFVGDVRRAIGALGDALSADLDGVPQELAAQVVFVRQELLGLIERCEGKAEVVTEPVFEGWDASDTV